LKILIVDDDSVDRELARRCLSEIEELEIVPAVSGDEALELVAREAPDIVLTDLRMPGGLSGLELVERRAPPRACRFDDLAGQRADRRRCAARRRRQLRSEG
jgi:CheY-like chemotaxis protein